MKRVLSISMEKLRAMTSENERIFIEKKFQTHDIRNRYCVRHNTTNKMIENRFKRFDDHPTIFPPYLKGEKHGI